MEPVLLLPGIVLPASIAYAALIDALGDDTDVRLKDLAVYDTGDPPVDYSLATEVAGIARFADAAGWDRLHLVGYSGGGSACLAFVARHPDRVLSLAVMEPAFAGWWAMTPPERAVWDGFRTLLDEDDPGLMAGFQSLQLAPGVRPPPPPSGPAPGWMAQRPAGIRAILNAFFASDIESDALRRSIGPAWCALGGRSNPDYFPLAAARLGTVLPELTIEVFPERHHFDPPHRAEPDRVASSLRALWDRAPG
jgi:pimeloyl-ACP methyl ester carboxylesterase